jgi:2-iminobutanoate/2-iminopropanoate deaminase
MNGEELKSSGRLLRIVSSDRSGLGFKVDEYLDETVYIPIKDSMPIVPKSNTLAVDGVGDFDVQRVRSMLLGALSELDKLPETAIKFSITSPRVMKSEKYSHAIVAGGMVYTSGIIATNIEFGGLIEGDVRKQTIQALENLKEILLSAGSNMKCVCRMTVILRDIQDLEIVNAVYSEYFPKNSDQPARVCFASSGIPMNALIEVEAIAVLPAMNRKIRTEE